jgi:glycosyltransferase involved in cell wall biosynthesis
LVIASPEFRFVNFLYPQANQVLANSQEIKSLKLPIYRSGKTVSTNESRKLRIGINASMLDLKPTGVGIFTYNLINHMHRQLMQDDSRELTIFSPTSEMLDAGLRIAKVPKQVQASEFPRTSAISRLAWNQLVYPLVARKMDVLLNPSTHGHLWGGLQILTIHDLISLRYPDISPHQHLYFKKILPWMIRKSTGIITVSEFTRQDVIRQFSVPPEKVHVVENGFDRKQFFPKPLSGIILKHFGIKDYILAIGPTYPHKNFETLINAFALLSPEKRRQHPLLIAGGRATYVDYLKKISADAGLTADIHFAGYVPQELMPALYREAQLLVFPSLYEGFGIPLLEAMACGCPIVCSNISSMPEICQDAAFYVDPLQVTSIHEGINRLISEESLRRFYSVRGIQRASYYSWERAASEMNQLITEISITHNIPDHV